MQPLPPSRPRPSQRGFQDVSPSELREINAVKRAFNGLIDWRPLSCSNTCFLLAEAASPVLKRVDGCQADPARSVHSISRPSRKSIFTFETWRLSSPRAPQTWEIGAEAARAPARVGRLLDCALGGPRQAQRRTARAAERERFRRRREGARRGPGRPRRGHLHGSAGGALGHAGPHLGRPPLAGGTKSWATPGGLAAGRRAGPGARGVSGALCSLVCVGMCVTGFTQSRPSVEVKLILCPKHLSLAHALHDHL